MKRVSRIIITIIMCLLVCGTLSAAVCRLGAVDGKVSAKIDGKWISAKPGLKLDEKDMIRVGRGASVVLRMKSGVIQKIQGPKVMKIRNLMDIMPKKNALSKLASLRRKVTGFSGPTAVAGVRGSDVSEQVADLDRFPISPSDLIWED